MLTRFGDPPDHLLIEPCRALHSATVEATMADGDAKLAGRADEVTDEDTIARFTGSLAQHPPGPFHLSSGSTSPNSC